MDAQKRSLACVVSPNPADADLALEFLAQAGIEARAYASLLDIAQVLDERTGCLILVEEALVQDEIPALRDAIGRLPAWADVPLIVVSREVGALGLVTSAAFPNSGNVTLLGRPLNPHTLVSATQVGLRASARQREVGELIAQREQAVKLRDEFLAMLAHELRNPLAPMSNAVYILRTLQIDDPMGRKSIDILRRQITHVARMVDDLMDVARLERGKVTLQKSRVDLQRVVAGAVDTCLPAAQERGHHLSVHFGAAALPVDADPVRLEQIVCNLVNNAVKFSREAGRIDVGTAVEDGLAVVSVRDRGIGFEPALAEKLFAPFLQVNPTLERTAGGLGMGLTIVRRLVALHGGSVHATSDGPGKGARFVVRLPLVEGEVPLTAHSAPAPVQSERQRRVVVIEDNADIRDTLRTLLDMWGHESTMTADGLTGLERVLRERPDVVLIDIGLPGMNGYDVARAIRRNDEKRDIRLIAVTGYGQPSDKELALQAGFDAHLLKPISPDILRRVLAE